MDERTTDNRPPGGDNGTRSRFGWLRFGRERGADWAEAHVADTQSAGTLDIAPKSIVIEAESSVIGRLRTGVRHLPLGRPEPSIAAFGAVIVTVAFLGGLTYFGAREFTGRAADDRGADEAASLAQHSARLATGDSFNGYLQILKYAEDPLVRAKETAPNDRIAALQQLIYLNTNKLDSLAVADRAGIVLASTDPSFAELRSSEAFNTTRATLGPANSDIILLQAGKPGYVEFTAPLRDPDGTIWAILYGRADPARLWSETLKATVDGSRNVIINSDGQFSAGVPDTFLRSAWSGEALDNGSVRATIDGTDSICGLGPIGRATQIDHGWNVASCLPAALMQAEASHALGKQALVTLAGGVLAVVFAGSIIRFSSGGSPAARSTSESRPAGGMPELALVSAPVTVEAPPALWADVVSDGKGAPDHELEAGELGDPEQEEPTNDALGAEPAVIESPAPPPAPIIVADVDALSLIEAYERRNARLSEKLRESVLARLMVAATQAGRAYRLAESDPDAASALHARAMDELEEIRERDLRAIGQELHPGLVRLGLPSALRSLAKEFGGQIDVSLDVDPEADRVSGGNGSFGVATPVRLASYRAIRDAVDALAAAGAPTCHIALKRDEVRVSLSLVAPLPDESAFDLGALDAGALSLAAYGASLAVESVDGDLRIACTLPANELPAEERTQNAEAAGAAGDWRPLDDSESGGGDRASSATDGARKRRDDADASSAGTGSASGPSAAADGQTEPGRSSPPGRGGTSTDATAVGALAGETSGRLRALLGDLRDGVSRDIELTLDVGPGADAALNENAEADLRALIGEAARNLVAAGAARCTVSIRNSGGGLTVDITSDSAHPPFDERHPGEAWDVVASHGGRISVSHCASATTVSAELPLGADSPLDTDDEAAPAPRITVMRATPDPLGVALRALAHRVAQSIDLRVQVDPAVDALNADGDHVVDGVLRGELFRSVEGSASAFAAAGAARCDVAVQRDGGNIHVTMTADAGDAPFHDAALASAFAIVDERGGEFSISRVGTAIAITARVPLEDPDAPKVVRLDSIAPLVADDEVA